MIITHSMVTVKKLVMGGAMDDRVNLTYSQVSLIISGTKFDFQQQWVMEKCRI